VKGILTERKPLLHEIASILLEKEVIEGEELRTLVREYAEKEHASHDDEPEYRKEADRSY
jgi:ATP-dependent Zn protease